MKTFFVQIKCEIGKTYEISENLLSLNIASEIYSTAGKFDIMAKFHVDNEVDIGLFVNDFLGRLPGVRDSETIIGFKAFI
ncbi:MULTISPECIES: Lrp/AsnC ligand binding domain-containing protein [unclassified Methylobacterium]|uniref:Lrp/AsnC ligand binding domain-containing protein n=1 Tax=unclassified Methylobacterium TaxID=2615210 RepID=UPI000477D485|nr:MULTISPECIES: Lrp/AsnC family transcriptional regulator [unclassified Methylobacterium]KQP39521.1 AsnC family transcriptional regulator [Methylobacterium sp. Leaf106]